MAELAVFSRAHPAGEKAKAKKAPRSKFFTAPRCKKFRDTARVTRSASAALCAENECF